MTLRTIHALYYRCERCGHLWAEQKPGAWSIVLPLHIKKARRRSTTVIVNDVNGREVGLIHQRNGHWMNYPAEEANRMLTAVPIGPLLRRVSATPKEHPRTVDAPRYDFELLDFVV